MRKLLFFMLLFFFVSGLFTVTCNPVSSLALMENSWNTKTSMNQARYGLCVVAVDDKIYAIGGYAVDGVVGTNERYDTKTDTWTTLEPMPTPRNSFYIAAYEGKIYCVGNGPTEVYDTATDSWSTKTSQPFDKINMQTHVLEGKFFFIGILGGDLYMYDPVKDSWTNKTSIPAPDDIWRHDSGNIELVFSVVVDNKLIVKFNYAKERGWGTNHKVMSYDPKTDAWTEEQVGSLGEYARGDAVVTTGRYAPQKVYVFFWASNYLVYDLASNEWVVNESLPVFRSYFGVAVVDDVLYLIGGCSDYHETMMYAPGTPTALNEQYVPIGYGTVTAFETAAPTHLEVFLSYRVIVACALIVGLVVASLFFYFKLTKKGSK